VSGILTISSQVYSTSYSALESATGYYAFRIINWNSYGLVGLEYVISSYFTREKKDIYTCNYTFRNSDVS
jgi:hypothetical protein